ncbi:DEAD/DEAH box helicase [Candidatus Saccharibacteria bacterium]|nr:DEAD/DEAH box helicase [Candidatus Saccharibacteria bacterium]
MPYNSRTNNRPSRGRSSSFSGGGGGRSSRRPSKENIHASRFIKAASIPTEENTYTPTHQFSDFAIDELLQVNLRTKGIITPSPIQDQSIPAGLNGQDIIGIANTGTGKTIAFAIPLLDRLIADRNSRALIMAPTRELAKQIEDECREIAKGSGLTGALLIGGAPMGPQLRDLRGKPRIVIGTPGRIKDHMERGSLDLSTHNIVVLDEVDRMLDMGFVADMREILAELNTARQSFFFSATMDPKVSSLINEFSHDPITVSVKTGDTTDTVEQNVVRYGSRNEKMEKLHDILADQSLKVLVFDETQRSVERLSDELNQRGFRVDAIHGGKSQGARQRALNRFKANDISILVATDVAARGIDVSDITHVINYTTPQSYSDYVHRIGRAGRAGRVGYALTFIEG